MWYSCTHSTGQEERRYNRILLHMFIQSCFFLFISPLFIFPLFISPLFISPLFIYLPRTLGLSLFYTLSSHPHTAGHATSPGRQLQLIRAAGACLHQNVSTITCSLVRWHKALRKLAPSCDGKCYRGSPHVCSPVCFWRNTEL